MRLTDKACKNIKPDKKPRKLADGDGLYLHVMPGGGKYWRFNYRFAGKHKTLAIGVYPEVPLAEAREKRQSARKQLRDGVDPSFAKREEKHRLVLDVENNFEAIAREWHQHNIAKWSGGHAKFILRRLEADLFPAIGRLPIKDITPPVLLNAVRPIENRGAFETARKLMQTCGQIFRYAIVTGSAERNIAADLRGALKPFKKGHFAALEAKDLPEFLEKLHRNDARLFVLTRLAVEMLMLTFVRTSELIEAKWEEFDLEKATWAIPAERMKMRRPHIVPLAKQVLAILEQIRAISGNREYVFPNQAKPLKHMSNNTVLFALGRMGYKGKATGHGFRALAMSTIKEKLDYRHEVVDRQLAHVPRSKVDRAYDRAKFLDERKKMMQEWADYLDAVASDKKVIVGKFCNAD